MQSLKCNYHLTSYRPQTFASVTCRTPLCLCKVVINAVLYFLDFLKVKCTADLIHIRNYPGVCEMQSRHSHCWARPSKMHKRVNGVNKCYQTLSCISKVSTVSGVLVHKLFLL